MKMSKKIVVTAISILAMATIPIGCSKSELSIPPVPNEIISLKLLKMVEIGNEVIRPKIHVTDDRVFVLYHDITAREYKVKIFDRDVNNEILTKTLVTSSSEYGNPTDLRMASDSEFIYATYETANPATKTSYSFMAKYTLDDNFDRVAYTGAFANVPTFNVAGPGDERMDDTAPMVTGENAYAMTRYQTEPFAQLSKEGETIFKIYELNKDLEKITEFDLNISNIADGGAKQSSIIFEDGYYFLVTPTTTGECIGLICYTDILMLKLDLSWNVLESKIIKEDENYGLGYIINLQSDDNYFYIVYNKVIPAEITTSVIGIYDKQWNNVLSEEYKTIYQSGSGSNISDPSIYVTDNRIYAGNNYGEIYIYEILK
jgi:hypothetical protein